MLKDTLIHRSFMWENARWREVSTLVLIGVANRGRDPGDPPDDVGETPSLICRLPQQDLERPADGGEEERTVAPGGPFADGGGRRTLSEEGSKIYIEGDCRPASGRTRAAGSYITFAPVVVRGFGGTMVMLDSRGGGAPRMDGGDPQQVPWSEVEDSGQTVSDRDSSDFDDGIPF